MTGELPLQGPQFLSLLGMDRPKQTGLYHFEHGKYARDLDADGRQLVCTVTEECTYRTSAWHVDDGSAEEEYSGHYSRVHRKGA